jgi:hypothetical protein
MPLLSQPSALREATYRILPIVDTAKLEIYFTNTNSAAVTVIGTDVRTTLTITFLG